jgi:hypothetical protein
MTLSFPSLMHPETTGYTIHEGYGAFRWSEARSPHVADWAGRYDTYGHGIVQHSPEVTVGVDRMGDYCASLATFAAGDGDAARLVGRHWPAPLSRATIRFLLGIRHVEGKRRYFNRQELKVSSSESKRHDRRWMEVPDWADGTVKSAYMLFDFPHPQSLLESWCRWSQVRDLAFDELGVWAGGTSSLMGLEDGRAGLSSGNLHTAMVALEAVAQAAQAVELRDRSLATLKGNLQALAGAATA